MDNHWARFGFTNITNPHPSGVVSDMTLRFFAEYSGIRLDGRRSVHQRQPDPKRVAEHLWAGDRRAGSALHQRGIAGQHEHRSRSGSAHLTTSRSTA